MERKCLKELLSCDEIGLDVDIIKSVKNILKEASKVNSEIEQLKQEKTKMGESVGRQLQDKDTNHYNSTNNSFTQTGTAAGCCC